MKPPIAINIETHSNPDAILPDLDVKLGNLKDPEKIRQKKQEAVAEQRARAALDPYTGQILCISIATSERILSVAGGANERSLLTWAWRIINANGRRIFTFNGAEFDIPYLIARSLVHRVEYPANIECNRYRVANLDCRHFDVFQYLTQFSPGAGSRKLRWFAKVLLDKEFPYEDIDQSKLEDVPYPTVQSLCEWNTKTTLELAELINGLASQESTK